MITDETDRLSESTALQGLLAHYAELAAEDRQVWHARLARLPEPSDESLVGLYGELLAYGWLEQNTGHTELGEQPLERCYRVTPAGLRALRAARTELADV
jgi:hypothetical protein